MEPTLEAASRRNQRSAWRALGMFALMFGACLAAILVIGGIVVFLLGEDVLGGRTAAEAWTPSLGCNVVGIAVRGSIQVSPEDCTNGCYAYTSSDEVLEYLKAAADDDSIGAILLDIDSSGGEPVASEEIANAVKAAGKPVIAWIRQSAASGAYWIASGATTIVASENSDIGSIGVTMSYLDNVAQNERDGLHFNSLSSAKFKDTGSQDKELSEEDVDLLRRDLLITHENFVAAIAANRNLPLETVAALADGSTMLGRMALENGLIDMIGGQAEAYGVLEESIGEKPEVCWAGL